MAKILRRALFIALIIIPIIFYKSLNKGNDRPVAVSPLGSKEIDSSRPSIALIFDDLGESLNDLKELYSLKIPLTLSVIPNLKFSRNIAHIGSRCGFSVFIHLPLEPKDKNSYQTKKYRFISSNLSQRENQALLRRYLDSLRIAIGVNNHMGSKATEDERLMKLVIRAIKRRGLIFVDSRTSANSLAYKIADEAGLVCGYSEGFLDSLDDEKEMEKRLSEFITKAKEKGKIIIIAHPKKNTLNFLKKKLPALLKEIEFITIKDYFEL